MKRVMIREKNKFTIGTTLALILSIIMIGLGFYWYLELFLLGMGIIFFIAGLWGLYGAKSMAIDAKPFVIGRNYLTAPEMCDLYKKEIKNRKIHYNKIEKIKIFPVNKGGYIQISLKNGNRLFVNKGYISDMKKFVDLIKDKVKIVELQEGKYEKIFG